MKPHVLIASRSAQLKSGVKAHLADLCTVSATGNLNLSAAFEKKDFQALVVDTRMPGLDGLTLLHTLRHHGKPELFVVSVGFCDRLTTLGAQELVRWVSLPDSPLRTTWETLRAFFDPASSRSIGEVRYQPNEKVFFAAFRNGKSYELSRDLIESDDGTLIVGDPEVIHGGEAFKVRQKSGNTYEVAWDFVLYHQEPSYPYHKTKASQQETETRRAGQIAARIRKEREARGWSLGDLARRTGMQRPNLSRLESGRHVPSLETLERLAEALGVRVVDLVAA
jgi:DNA-binding Xre family transcriptional regulator/CheY-like chemotaxis protein